MPKLKLEQFYNVHHVFIVTITLLIKPSKFDKSVKSVNELVEVGTSVGYLQTFEELR